jgi:hypothetical protein
MTKRILHVYKDYFPVLGGIENHVRDLAEAQAAAGYAVTVLVHSLDRHTHVEELNGVRVIKAGRLATVASTPVGLALPWLLSRERPDLVHLQFPYPFGEAAQLFFGPAPRSSNRRRRCIRTPTSEACWRSSRRGWEPSRSRPTWYMICWRTWPAR